MSEEAKSQYSRRLKSLKDRQKVLETPKRSYLQRLRDLIDTVSPRHRK